MEHSVSTQFISVLEGLVSLETSLGWNVFVKGGERKKDQHVTDERESEGAVSSLLARSCCREKEELRDQRRGLSADTPGYRTCAWKGLSADTPRYHT